MGEYVVPTVKEARDRLEDEIDSYGKAVERRVKAEHVLLSAHADEDRMKARVLGAITTLHQAHEAIPQATVDTT